MMELDELLNEIDEFNDGIEDTYNMALHNLTEEEAEKLTVKEFLLNLLKEHTEI
jgi:hypothetical protein